MLRVSRISRLAVAALALLLTACGGGGGAGDDPDQAVREALPTLVSDTVPAGERIDRRADQYFAAAEGDRWTYDRLTREGAGTFAAVTRTATMVSDGGHTITEVQQGLADEVETYVRTADGLSLADPSAGAFSDAARRLIGNVLFYPEPFYPVGSSRTSVRQGSLGADTDGDGVADSFRLELVQTVVGFETVTPPLGRYDALHLRTTLTLTLSPSSLAQPVVTVSGTEDSWWAPGVGLVQAQRLITDASGATQGYSLFLASAVRAGNALPAQVADGTVRQIALLHQALVFDPVRQRYYASMSAQAGSHANQIATIDAATGQVSYSAAVGAAPSALALAADGSALYVGLDGAGSLVKLALPDMNEVERVTLPVNTGDGSPLLVRAMAASPTEGDVLAVSLRSAGGGGNFPGVVLVRQGVVQPLQIAFGPLYTMGPLAFAGDGSRVYSYGNNFGDATLFALDVAGDGLALASQTARTTGHGIRDLDWTPQGIVASRGFYRGSDLEPLSVFSPYGCRAHAAVAARLVCIGVGTSQLTVIDAAARTELGVVSYANLSLLAPGQLVPGPAGQVAMRMNTASDGQPAGQLWLFDSPALR